MVPTVDELSIGLLGIFPLDDVVLLSILLHDNNAHFKLSHQISQLPALNALCLKKISSTPFLQEFAYHIPGETSAVFPALRYLEFTIRQTHVPILTTLYNCLKKRSELGLGPEKLKVDICALKGVDKQATALLEKAVNVMWVKDDLDF